MKSRTDFTVSLVFPPFFFNDFQGPYLSIPQLAGFLRANEVSNVQIVDANMKLWRKITSPAYITNALRTLQAASIAPSERKQILQDQLLLRYVIENPDAINNDTRIMRMYSSFVFSKFYSQVLKDVSAQVQALSQGCRIPELEDVVDLAVSELKDDTQILGLTVPTADQFYPALAVAKAAKERFGDSVHVVFGGPIFALISAEQLETTVQCPYVDSIVIHEGEKSLLALCDHISGRCSIDQVPDLLYCTKGMSGRNGLMPTQPLNSSPAPYFPDSLLENFGPSPQLPVWATRGCYWGKCTFCDYISLSANNNRAETIQVASFLNVIQELRRRHGADRFEVISECLSPAFCREFAEQILSREMDISWTTHLKVEKQFSRELCKTLKRSGCHRVTIGVESFNDRQLEVMQKGCTSKDIVSMLTHLRDAGIRAIINIIVDFPTVTWDEAIETLNALKEHRHLFFDVNVFPFVLSSVSEIATNPDEFGIIVEEERATRHHRGFHFSEFERTSGMSQTQCEDMLGKYQHLHDNLRRQVMHERSINVLAQMSVEDVGIRRSRHFISLNSEERTSAQQFISFAGSASLVYDLDSKRLEEWPPPVLSLYNALPSSIVPVSEIAEFIDGPCDNGFVHDLVRAMTYYGAIEVVSLQPQTEDLLVQSA